MSETFEPLELIEDIDDLPEEVIEELTNGKGEDDE